MLQRRSAFAASLAAFFVMLPSCFRGPAVPPQYEAAQRILVTFARALGAWDTAKLDSLVAGGAAHPAWASQKKSLEGRGIRFGEVKHGLVKGLTKRIAVGIIRFKLTGAGVAKAEQIRLARVALMKTIDGWRITFWGNKRAITRHLMWISKGGDPLQDPLFTVMK